PQPESNYVFQVQNPGTTRAIASGHLLCAGLGSHIVTIPLLRGRSRDEESILWREMLWPVPGEVGGPVPRTLSKNVTIPFDRDGRQETIQMDASGKSLATTGPMNHVGVTYQKIRTITSIEPLTGRPLWSHQDLDQGANLFGDASHV